MPNAEILCYIQKMLMAITRQVSSALANCELSFIPRQAIDMEKARAQHHAYEELLGKLGAQVISLPEEPDLPDSMFVEDPAIVFDELAVICPLGTETRRKEAPSLAAALEKHRKLAFVKLPGMLEGGDVLRIGKKVFVGLTKRTNAEGIRQLAVILEKHGYDVTVALVTGCLHLKSAVTYLGRNTLLANRAWFDPKRLEGFEWVDVDPAEPHAGNALALGDSVIFPASFPKTRQKIEARGFQVLGLDISELQKAESGLTCSSLIFEA
ncbi:MAG TPA: arginine deiminase family protein [Candidatus Sulfotelmatobacter sp.]|nr:arginine deiminase family protein [Candidatus Sulfotelmatobacter sp.]